MREKRIRVWRKMSRKEMQKKEKENMGRRKEERLDIGKLMGQDSDILFDFLFCF
jgi:hypothetical protein